MKLFLATACFLLLIVSGLRAQELAPTASGRAFGNIAGGQWNTSFESLRSQLDALVQQYDTLSKEYARDKQQEERLRRMLGELQQKNAGLRQYLKERGGVTDQQLRVQFLEDQLKIKRLEHSKKTLEHRKMVDDIKVVADRVEKKRNEVSALELQRSQAADAPPPPAEDAELVQWREDLKKQEAAEAALSDQLNAQGQGDSGFEARQLEERIKALEEHKASLMQKPLVPQDNGNAKRNAAMARKNDLENKIRHFETRIEGLKAALASGNETGVARKHLVQDMVKADQKKKKLVSEINELKENIALLKTQIGVLEKRVLFSKGK